MSSQRQKPWGSIVTMLAVMAALVVCAAPAEGSIIGGDLAIVEVSSSLGASTWHIPFPPGLPPQVPARAHWALQHAHEMRTNQGALLATFTDLEIDIVANPVVQMNFTATAGAADVTITISTAVLSFSTLTNPIAYATADVTLTDLGADGASFAPLPGYTGAYEAVYNGSTQFAELIGPMTISGGASTSQSTGTGVQTIAGAVSSIQGHYRFALSAEDTVTGNGYFDVIPEPASLALLAAGGLALLRRRR